MNPLFAAAVEFQVVCARRGWRSSVIGGVAVQRWGDPRQTRDVDLTLLTGLGGEEAFVEPILEHYRGRISDAHRFALERRVLLVETGYGVPLDISLGGLLMKPCSSIGPHRSRSHLESACRRAQRRTW